MLLTDSQGYCLLCGAPFLDHLGYEILSNEILGFGIPTYGLQLIVKNREYLNEDWFKEKFAFMYNGYRSNSYYWEFFVMYRKIAVIFIQVFLAQQGKIV